MGKSWESRSSFNVIYRFDDKVERSPWLSQRSVIEIPNAIDQRSFHHLPMPFIVERSMTQDSTIPFPWSMDHRITTKVMVNYSILAWLLGPDGLFSLATSRYIYDVQIHILVCQFSFWWLIPTWWYCMCIYLNLQLYHVYIYIHTRFILDLWLYICMIIDYYAHPEVVVPSPQEHTETRTVLPQVALSAPKGRSRNGWRAGHVWPVPAAAASLSSPRAEGVAKGTI